MARTWTITSEKVEGLDWPIASVPMYGGALVVGRAPEGLRGLWRGAVPEMTRDWAVEHLGKLVDGAASPVHRQTWEDERQRVAAGPEVVLKENPNLEARIGLAHRSHFFIPTAAFTGISVDLAAEVVAHHWQDAPPVRHGAAGNPAVLAFETAMLDAVCWEAPAALRAHFRQCRWHLHEAFRNEPPPVLFVADTDPL